MMDRLLTRAEIRKYKAGYSPVFRSPEDAVAYAQDAKTAAIKDQEYQEKIREIFAAIRQLRRPMFEDGCFYIPEQDVMDLEAKYLGKEEA